MTHQFEFVQPLKEEYTCKVCKEAWDPDAVSQCSDCEATFCKACFDEAVDKDSKCHSCLKQPATFNNVHMLVRSMATNLNVFCRYKAHGCEWRGTRGAYPGHVDTCDHKPKDFCYVDDSLTPAELMCPLCHCPFVDPVQLPCEHSFCSQCITEAMARNPQCPMDRTDYDVARDLKPTPSIIQEMLDDLMVHCPHSSITAKPCLWVGRRRDYRGHKAGCRAGIQPTQKYPPLLAAGQEAQSLTVTAIPEFPSYDGTLPGDRQGSDSDSGSKTGSPTGSDSPTDPRAETKAPATAGGDSPKLPPQDSEAVATKAQRMYVLAHIEAPELPATHSSRTKPLHLSIALDNSGSMGGDRIASAKASVSFIVSQCTSLDSVGLIVFNSDMRTVFPLIKMDPEGKAKAQGLIEKIDVSGCTNLSGGIEAAINLLVDSNKKTASSSDAATQAINGVLAFTDGAANEGLTDVRQLCSFVQPKVQVANTVVHTFGFGTNHSAKMLQNIAEIGSGSYYYIQNTESMKEHFADCLGGLMSTVAQNIQLTVKPQPGFKVDKVLSSYEVKSAEDGTAVVTMRDLYSAEQRDVLVRLKMTSSQIVGDQVPVVDFNVAYDSLLSGSKDEVKTHCVLVMGSGRSKESANQKVREQKMRLRVTRVLKAATAHANTGNYAAGRKILQEAKATLFPTPPKTSYEEELYSDLEMVLDGMKDQHSYTTYGGPVSSTITLTHTQQRSCTIASIQAHTVPNTSVSNTRSYDTSAKATMRMSSVTK